jgi:hypothetical protein
LLRIFVSKIVLRASAHALEALKLRCALKKFLGSDLNTMLQFYEALVVRVVDSGLDFAALPRVRARCGALRQAAPHFLKNPKSSPVRPAQA